MGMVCPNLICRSTCLNSKEEQFQRNRIGFSIELNVKPHLHSGFDSGTDICIGSVDLVRNITHNTKTQFTLPITFSVNRKKMQANVLINSEATIMFINIYFIKKFSLKTNKLLQSSKITNIDSSINKEEILTDYKTTDLDIGSHESKSQLLCTDLRNTDILIRHIFL